MVLERLGRDVPGPLARQGRAARQPMLAGPVRLLEACFSFSFFVYTIESFALYNYSTNYLA
jgi:hypothetical protein